MFELPEELLFIRNGKAVQKHSEESMAGQICVVSGATSGVGYETVKALAAGGAQIVMVVRNETKAQMVKAELERKYAVVVDYVIADFTDLETVQTAAQAICARYPRIDVLINSVGIYSTTRIMTKAGFEMVFCVNHLATFLLTQLLLPKMIASAPARIIQVNSEGHRFNGLDVADLNWQKRIYTGLRGYGAAKTAQLLTVWQMATDLAGTGVTINAVHPGGVRTNLGNNNGRLYRWFLHHVTWHFLREPTIAGAAIYYLASAPELSQVSGRFFNLTIPEKPAQHALDRENQQRIWDLSLAMTGLVKKDE